MNVVAVIQARMGSTRLPGKVMMEIAGQPMLARVVNRVRQANTVNVVVIATTIMDNDDVIVDVCDSRGWDWFRGSEDDVLDRYYQAALTYHADAVVRICADCPLIDPGVIDLVVQAFLDESPDCASNTLVRTYPRGLGLSVMSMDALTRAWYGASELYQRAHVTAYIHQNLGLFRLLSVVGEMDYSNYRWTVDTPEDLAFVRMVYNHLGGDAFSWYEVIEMLANNPELANINSHVEQKSLVEG